MRSHTMISRKTTEGRCVPDWMRWIDQKALVVVARKSSVRDGREDTFSRGTRRTESERVELRIPIARGDIDWAASKDSAAD